MNPYQNQYPYNGSTAAPSEQQFLQMQQNQEKLHIKRLSWGAAAAVGGYFLLANLLYGLFFLIYPSGTSNGTESALILTYSIDLLITFLALILPFAIIYYLFTKQLKAPPLPLNKPFCGAKTETLLLIGGIGLVLLASYVSSYLSLFIQMMTGMEFLYTDTAIPSSAFGIIIYYLRMVIFPAMAEEFAMRGVIMQSLRRWGDTFALAMSSLVFALMHGNMVQAPFALLAGFILGYAVIRSGSLWTAIIIHMINNGVSVTLSLIAARENEAMGNLVTVLVSGVLIVAGILCFAILFKQRKLPRPFPNRTMLPSRICYQTFILTIPMILVLLYMIGQTLMMIKIPWLESLVGWN